jgi:hypothetical protein
MVVAGMAWSIDSREGESTHVDDLAVLDRDHLLRWSRQNFTPQGLHLVLVDSGGTGDELAGIHQVGCAEGVHIDGGPLPCPPPGSSGVIEMDVGHQDMTNVSRCYTVTFQTSEECL